MKQVRGFTPLRTEGTWTQAGVLLVAAETSELTVAQRDAVIARALHGASTVRDRRGLLVDIVRLGLLHLVPRLELSDSEVRWTIAAHAAASGNLSRASSDLCGLPAERYPGRLAIWFRAASLDQLPPDDVDNILECARQLGEGSPTARVASVMLVSLVDNGSSQPAVLDAVHDARSSGTDAVIWSRLLPDGAWRTSETFAARLLGAREEGAQALGDDPEVLDYAPSAILDDLIDARAINPTWLEASERLRCGPYLRARVWPAEASEDDLRATGHEAEVTRRAWLQGEATPGELPAQFRSLIRCWQLHTSEKDTDDVLASLRQEDAELGRAFEQVIGDNSTVVADLQLSKPGARKLLAKHARLPGNAPPSDLTDRQREFVGLTAAFRAKDALHRWGWSEAVCLAKEGIRYAREETLRDELLNLLACGHWQQGRDEDALRALEAALEGEYTEALQANIAVVARNLASETAADHLSRLVLEAPNLELRASAARHAVNIWGFSDEPWASTDLLPTNLAAALRSLVVENISRDDFRLIAHLLADYDAEWFRTPGRLQGSPHAETDEAKVWLARAKSHEDYLEALGAVLRRSDTPAWAQALRDELVAVARGAVIVDEPSLDAAAFGMMLLDEELPMDPHDAAVLRAFVARAVAMNLDSDDEPNLKFLDWLEEAAEEVHLIPDELRERAKDAIDMGLHALTFSYLRARWAQTEQAAHYHDSLVDEVRGMARWQINTRALGEAVGPIRSHCHDTRNLLLRLRSHADEELRQHIDDLLNAVDELDRLSMQFA